MAQPRIIIVGGGFGGVGAAKALKNTPVEIILIDRANHHLFQPLLYQVPTTALTPRDIAGPTGVELAGALAVLVRTTLKSEFRRIDPASARIVLVDMAPRVLPPFSEKLSKAAKQRLEKLGVEVRLGHSVDQIDADGIVVAGARQHARYPNC